MENKNNLAVQDTAKSNPIRRFFSAMNEKRKKLMTSITTSLLMSMMTAVTAFADEAGGGTDAGEAEFNKVIEFFATWIGRIGLVVGFVGAIMFALAIKNEDAEAKTRGLMTLASGFVVFAITKALDMFMGAA